MFIDLLCSGSDTQRASFVLNEGTEPKQNVGLRAANVCMYTQYNMY
jgi:hypothetical protein